VTSPWLVVTAAAGYPQGALTVKVNDSLICHDLPLLSVTIQQFRSRLLFLALYHIQSVIVACIHRNSCLHTCDRSRIKQLLFCACPIAAMVRIVPQISSLRSRLPFSCLALITTGCLRADKSHLRYGRTELEVGLVNC
jgi:hypothetical protein